MDNKTIQEQIVKSQLKLQETWFDQNKEALEEYNNWVEKNGIFSDTLRRFCQS